MAGVEEEEVAEVSQLSPNDLNRRSGRGRNLGPSLRDRST